MMPGDKANIYYLAKKLKIKDTIKVVRSQKTGDEFIISQSPTYVAFSKKTTTQKLADTFSDVIAEMKKDGTYDTIRSKYLN